MPTGTLSLIFECKKAEKSIKQVMVDSSVERSPRLVSACRMDNIVVIVRRTSCSSGLVLGNDDFKVAWTKYDVSVVSCEWTVREIQNCATLKFLNV